MAKKRELPEQFTEPKMTNVHECLAEASSGSAPETMKNFSVRLPETLKDQAMFICERNATDLGSYLRECTKALVRDYGVKADDQE